MTFGRALAKILPGLIGIALTTRCLGIGQTALVETNPQPGGFVLCEKNHTTVICVDTNDWPGVRRAAGDLQRDLQRVTGQIPLLTNGAVSEKNVVIIGTVGKSEIIDHLIRTGKINATAISNQWESSFIQTIPEPWPGVNSALVICGSDKRGTIYGIYGLSEQIGVSPWHYWADVPAKQHAELFIKPGKFLQGPPAVKYRGIFINDEAPALTGWIQKKFGSAPGCPRAANYGPGFYTNVFELMLRLRANYLWPAMWNNAFNEDDTNNPALADEYGIVMGTSHQEPMLRAQQEWDRGLRRQYGLWDYTKTNQRPVLQQFWREGIRRNKDFESIITMGLRAENDSGEHVGKELTEQIIGTQRQILAEEINPDLSQIPQVWCLYKEVMSYYLDGLRVPDDVTLLWAEDNWGNIRRLPTAEERHRRGGAGIYYHFDYHGSPRSYQWINTSPIAKIWDQMSLAKQYGADRIWIVNVGHLNKTSEFPLEFFMSLAWDTTRWTNENLDEFTRLWAAREFGAEHAEEIASLIDSYTQFNGRRKPELLDAQTYSLLNYREFETVAADYAGLTERAEKVYDTLPPESRDAFYGMVQYPIKAAAGLHALYLAAAKNSLYAKQGRASANDFAARTRELFAVQTNLANHFNRVFAGGKWDHFMDQAYIGYTNWSDPKQNNLNAVKLTEIRVPKRAALGVMAEGSTATTGGRLDFDEFGQPSRYVEIYNKGQTPFDFLATADVPWIILNERGGKIEKEKRIEVSVDWSKITGGKSTGEISFSGAGKSVTVTITASSHARLTHGELPGFLEADGYVSIEAEHFSRQTEAGQNRWIKIPNYGHTLSGMRADGPAETLVTPGKDSPCLEYPIYLFSTGQVEVASIVGPTLGFLPGRPLRYAVSFDDATPQIVTIVPEKFDGYNSNPVWAESVKNNSHRAASTHTIAQPGYHTLKIWMVDPAVVLQKHVINTGGVRPSYLGPPESFRH